MKPAVIIFTNEAQSLKAKRLFQRAQGRLQRGLDRGCGVCAQLARQGDVKAAFIKNIGLVPVHQQRILARTQV